MEKYYEIMSYDDLDYYYIFADARTYEILFVNQAFCNFLRLKHNSCIGKKCYEVLYNRDDKCPTCVNEELITSNFKCMESVISLNKIDINCNITLQEIDNKLVRVTKMPIHSNKLNLVNNLTVNDILADLLRNIKNNNFQIHIQPKFEITKDNNSYSSKVIGAEALVRRYDPNLHEIILPDEFISLYKNMSIIRHIDYFVLERTCQVLASIINNDKFTKPSFIISVNFSGATLLEFSGVGNIQSICDNYNIPYGCIMIEIEKDNFTEKHKNFIAMTLNKLSKLGFLIALSDINISNPKIFTIEGVEFDEIKISRHLTLDKKTIYNEDTKNIFKSVLQSYHTELDEHVVVVGIENKTIMEFFYGINCKSQQGFLHSNALTVDDFLSKYILELN